MVESSDTFIPQAPQFDDAVGSLLSSTVKWILGPGAVSATIVGIILLVVAVKSWLDLIKDTHKAAVGVAKLGKLVTTRLRAIPAVVIALNACLTVAVLSLQATWLYVTWRLGPLLTAWWNFPVWGSWELPIDQPWSSLTGYYTVLCGVTLLIGWVSITKFENHVDRIIALRTMSVAAALIPAILSIPVVLVLILALAVGILDFLLNLLPGFDTGSNFWAKFGPIYLGFLGFLGYIVGIFAAIMSTSVVAWAWQRTSTSSHANAG
jgi:hypothetical protein